MLVRINLELYEMLKKVETKLFLYKDEIKAIAFINFVDLDKFVEIVGRAFFCDDGGIDVKLQDYNICVELNYIFEYEGNTILDYKKCFNSEDIKRYKSYLEKQ